MGHGSDFFFLEEGGGLYTEFTSDASQDSGSIFVFPWKHAVCE